MLSKLKPKKSGLLVLINEVKIDIRKGFLRCVQGKDWTGNWPFV